MKKFCIFIETEKIGDLIKKIANDNKYNPYELSFNQYKKYYHFDEYFLLKTRSTPMKGFEKITLEKFVELFDKTDLLQIMPIAPGVFYSEDSLMSQLALLKTKELATQWYEQYLDFHKGIDQGVKYIIGYFTDEEHRNNLTKWLYGE